MSQRGYWWTPPKFAIAVFSTALVLWMWWWTVGAKWVAGRFEAKQLETLGQLGDLFGGINALFAAFAFAGVAVAAYYQHLSLNLLSAEAQRATERHARESFEPLFFKLLERVSRPSNVAPPPQESGTLLAGDDAFGTSVEVLRRQFIKSPWFLATLMEPEQTVIPFPDYYERLYVFNEHLLGPYFRAQYHVFKLIDRAQVSVEDKVEYANIARASLSTDELFLLALNCRTSRGLEFKTLIERWGLLKHIQRSENNETPDQAIAILFYAPTATMSRAEREAFRASRGITQ